MNQASGERFIVVGAQLSINVSEHLIDVLARAGEIRDKHQLASTTTANLLTQALITDPLIRDAFQDQQVSASHLEDSPYNRVPENGGKNGISGPARRALQRGYGFVEKEKTGAFSTRHLILGLINTPEGYAVNVIKEMEINVEALQSQMALRESLAKMSNPADRLAAALQDPRLPRLQRAAMSDVLRVLG